MGKERVKYLVSLYNGASIKVSCGRKVLEQAAALVYDFPDDIAIGCMKDYVLSRQQDNKKN